MGMELDHVKVERKELEFRHMVLSRDKAVVDAKYVANKKRVRSCKSCVKEQQSIFPSPKRILLGSPHNSQWPRGSVTKPGAMGTFLLSNPQIELRALDLEIYKPNNEALEFLNSLGRNLMPNTFPQAAAQTEK